MSLNIRGQKSGPSPEATVVTAVTTPMEIAVPGGAAVSQGPPEAVWLRDRGRGQRNTRDLPTFPQDDSGNLWTGQRTVSATKPRAEVQIP